MRTPGPALLAGLLGLRGALAGSPTFIVGDGVSFGNGRLDFLAERLCR